MEEIKMCLTLSPLAKYFPRIRVLSPEYKKYNDALQNKALPSLDLLVRESLQNSLDAAVDTQDGYSEIWVQ